MKRCRSCNRQLAEGESDELEVTRVSIRGVRAFLLIVAGLWCVFAGLRMVGELAVWVAS